MAQKLRSAMAIVQADPAVQDVVGFTGGGGGGPGRGGGATNTANIFVGLKPLSVRKVTSDRVIARLRVKLADITGVRLFLQAIQDIRAGGRQSNSQYQYTILSDDLSELFLWTPKITEALKTVPEIADVNSDRQDNGLDIALNIDRSTAARLGINLSEIDNTLYDAFGQRQVSTIYNDMNQYHVVMEVDSELLAESGDAARRSGSAPQAARSVVRNPRRGRYRTLQPSLRAAAPRAAALPPPLPPPPPRRR